ncbi:MAG: hypothetical protein ABSH23_03220 [Steroidobacteraceae bacterium]|jgi:hypothetical protein
MQAMPNTTVPTSGALAMPSVPATAVMDREFVARNQIVERYLSGRLPLKGAQDFERYCRENPHSLEEIGLSERLTMALRLLEAGGVAPPWEAKPKRWWERLPVLLACAALLLALAITVMVLTAKLSAGEHSMLSLRQRLATQALDPARSTRIITVIPDRSGPSARSTLTIGGAATEMADLKIDVSWSKFTEFRLTIDRLDQGRVAVLHNVLRDSNGQLHLGLNSSALGPGDYQFTIEGLTMHGEAVPQAWITISVAH